MPRKNPDGSRNYSQQKVYNASAKATAKRVENNKARREMIKEGKAQVGDRRDVDHIKPLSKGGTNDKSNLRVVAAGLNRSFSRNSDSSLKSQKSKREKKK